MQGKMKSEVANTKQRVNDDFYRLDTKDGENG